MEIKTKYMIKNDCYIDNRKIIPKGIMIHSTAAPGIMASDWFSRWNRSYRAGETNRQVCVHAFVDNNEAWKYLPWNHRGWHAGGKANNTHIGIEICEPAGFSYSRGKIIGYDADKNEAYFRKAWGNAIALCVMLCKEYGITERDVIGHVEGYKLGIASNHADPLHWFSKHGEDMETFRKAVAEKLNSKDKDELEEALVNMVEKGIINSPDYWLENAREGKTVKGEYAASIIKRVAGLIK